MLLKLPARILVAAPSQSGKSSWVLRVLQNRTNLLSGRVDGVIWACANAAFAPKAGLEKVRGQVKIVEGLPPLESIPPYTILVLDDLQMGNLKDVCHLFCVGSHHRNITIVMMAQNLFFANPYFRTISLNSSAIVLFNSVRISAQIEHLARQIFPELRAAFIEVFKEQTRAPFTYLLIDLSQACTPALRIKTNIFSKGYFNCFATQSEIEKCCNQQQQQQPEMNPAEPPALYNYIQ